jgi:hypothetical protein
MSAGAGFDVRWLDLALATIALEGAALLAWRWATGQGPRPLALIANLAAGAFLVIVARELVAGGGGIVAVAALSAALVAHGLDLAARWERKPRRGTAAAAQATDPNQGHGQKQPRPVDW